MEEWYCYVGGRDITKWIEEVSWESNDLDAPKSGRDLGGDMHRGKVGDKYKLLFKLIPIPASALIPIITSLRSQYISVRTNMLPEYGEVTYTGYNSSRKGGVMVMATDGILKHMDVSFNVIER